MRENSSHANLFTMLDQTLNRKIMSVNLTDKLDIQLKNSRLRFLNRSSDENLNDGFYKLLGLKITRNNVTLYLNSRPLETRSLSSSYSKKPLKSLNGYFMIGDGFSGDIDEILITNDESIFVEFISQRLLIENQHFDIAWSKMPKSKYLLRGPKGEKGERGVPGKDGEQGIEGPPGTILVVSIPQEYSKDAQKQTVLLNEWLKNHQESLRGAPGPMGRQGVIGQKGEPG